MPVSVYRGYTGTLGGFAVTREGDIVMIFSEHQVGDAQFGDPILLEPHGVRIGVVGRARIGISKIMGKRGQPKARCFKLPKAGESHNVNLRFRGLEEDLPIVMKHPIIPELGRLCVKSGFATGVTYGRIGHLDWSLEVELPDGGFNATFSDLIETTIPHLPGDEGSIITSTDRQLIGIAITGDESRTYAIPASRVLKSLNLDLIKLDDRAWKMLHGAGYARKFCDSCKVSLYPDTTACPFCGRKVYWGQERIEHYVKNGAP
jgi:hypothetical protein